jgi:ribosomal protein S6--L-glutamate ligase
MKKLIVASESSNLYTTTRFLQEGNRLNLQSKHINPFEQLIINTAKKQNKKNYASIYLFRTTGIRFDDYDICVAQDFANNGACIVNSLFSLENFRNKDLQMGFLESQKLPFIPTLSFRGKLTAPKIAAINNLKANQTYILKTNRGNGGIGVQIIRGNDSLFSILETYNAIGDQKFIIQPFKKHTTEYRILLNKSQILAVIERKITPLDFRGNAKRSVGKLLTKIDPSLSQLAQSAIMKSNLNYAGIDLYIDEENGPTLFEINAIPGFKQAEELTKKNIAREILISIIKDSQKD